MLYKTSRPTPTVHHPQGEIDKRKKRPERSSVGPVSHRLFTGSNAAERPFHPRKIISKQGHALLLLPFLDWADRASGDRFK
jgi:hypothetical protein